LRRELESIARTARSMAMTMPGLEDKFRAPRDLKDQELLGLARSFAADALPLKAEFVRRGLPADFLDELEDDLEAFEAAVNRRIQGTEAHITATAAIDDLIDGGIRTVRELGPIMRNIFAGDMATLAAWESASHIERAPRRNRPPTSPPKE